MENASKALLMAAGILISMMVISLALYLFITFGNASKNTHKKNEENQLAQFNSQFTSYANKSEGVNIYDVITMANLAKDNNENYGLTKSDEGENSYYIAVCFRDFYNTRYDNLENNTQDQYNELIKKHSNLASIEKEKIIQKTYNCKVDISNVTGRVYKVTITEK